MHLSILKSPLLAFGFGAILFLLCFGFPQSIQTQPDSESYLRFAEDIRTSRIFSHEQAPWYSVIRTPAYPAMLALFQSLIGNNPAAVLALHACLALLVLSFVILRFKKFVSPLILVLLTSIAFWLWKEYYEVVLTEWPALCFLLIFFCFIPQNYHECSAKRICTLGIILSVLILIRPALIACLLVVALIVLLVVRPSERRKVSVGILLGLLPLFFWCLFNSYRLGTFAPAAFTGHNLYGVASLLGSTEFAFEEWPDLARFSKYVNENKRPKAGLEHLFLDKLPGSYFSSPYNYNIYEVALQFEKERNYPRQYYDYLMSRYAKRVILENPLTYLRFVLVGLNSLSRDVWLLLISSIMLLMLIRSGHALSLVLGSALATHLFHVLLCSTLQIVISRYYLLTLIPLGFITVVSMLAVIKFKAE